MRLWSVPCIGCSSSCVGVLYATTVNSQMIHRYLRQLALSCLNVLIDFNEVNKAISVTDRS